MMWRHETKVHYRQLNKFEQSFVSAVAESGSIMAAAESAVAENPGKDPGREISTLFAGLLTAGILAKSNH